jgi:hypothetical protein
MILDKDAFSSGQVLSKTWLAEELERAVIDADLRLPLSILCLGGWYGITNFILRSRSSIEIEKFRSVDLDQDACNMADKLNEAWVWQNWQFKSVCHDANTFSYTGEEFNTVINTSVEHIESKQWFDNIPAGTLVALQSNNMQHDDHCHNHRSLAEFQLDFPLTATFYEGEKTFNYPNWNFTRFMIIGLK